MKQLLVYINPTKFFDAESKSLVKIQIDNSLDLGWKREDIILATNFPFEYNGVKALVLGDELYCDFYRMASKENAIIDLMERGVIKDGELYWIHDLDCYQCVPFSEDELDMEGVDLALTDYGSMTRWSTGSMFFKRSAEDIFRDLKTVEYYLHEGEEQSLMFLTENYSPEVLKKYKVTKDTSKLPRIRKLSRIRKINNSYNLIWLNLDSVYRKAIKPIRCVHFHPWWTWKKPKIDRMLDFFMYGKNKLNLVLMPKRLIRIFHYHRIK